MGWLALLVGLSAIGSDVSGTVTNAQGVPVAGARIWLVGSATVGNTDFEGEATSDDEGRFSITIPDEDDREPGSFWKWTAWASLPDGNTGVGVEVIAQGERPPDRPIRLVLGPIEPAVVRVLDPSRKPVEGARVRIDALIMPGRAFTSSSPLGLLDRLEVITDADGRATFDAVPNARLASVVVRADGFGWQPRWFEDDGEADREVWLRPVGRLEGRLVADDPEAVAGWTVYASTTTADESGLNRSRGGTAQAKTDEQGRFVMPELAEGISSLSFRHPEGSRDRAEKSGSARIEAGATTEVEVRIGRGKPVEGVVRDVETGEPIAGIELSFAQEGWNSGVSIRTDEQGRFSVVALPGELMLRVWKAPEPYIPPGQAIPEGFAVAEEADRIELPPIELRKGVKVPGVVRDGQGEPVAGARVMGVWSKPMPGGGSSGRSISATTDEQGRFVFSPVILGAEIRLEMESPGLVLETPPTILAGAEGEAELTVSVIAVATPRGRVVGADGQPIAGATVRFSHKNEADPMGRTFARPFQPRPWSTIQTEADGTFRTPEPVAAEHAYSVEVTAPGHFQARSPWITPAEDGEVLPTIILEKPPAFRSVAGQVVDLQGEPVAGALVFQAGDGPRRTETTSDQEGRFRLEGVYDRDAFVFAQADGFRFLGLVVPADRAGEEVEIRLPRLDEPHPRPMSTLARPLPTDQEREIARSLLAPLLPGWLALSETSYSDSAPRWSRSDLLVTLARLDPERAIELIERQVVWADAPLLSAIALGLFDQDPAGAMEALDSVGLSAAYLSVFDERPNLDPAVRQRLLDRAAEQAESFREPRGRILELTRVAERWLAIGQPERARPLLNEVRAAFEQYPRTSSASLLRDIAGPLASIDPEAALALIDRLDDPNDSDGSHASRARAAVAEAIAATEPALAERLLIDAFQDFSNRRYEIERILPPVVYWMAPADLPRAIALADRVESLATRAFLRGVIAFGLAASDPEEARRRLDEAFGMLGAPGIEGRNSLSPSMSNARLLMSLVPVAERIDPDLTPDFFWRALALRADLPQTRSNYDMNTAIELVALASRYDRDAAAALLGPLIERLPGIASGAEPRWDDVFGILRTASAIDPARGASLIDRLAGGDAPDPSRSADRASAAARVVLANLLSRPIQERRRGTGPGSGAAPRLPGDQ